MRFKHVAVLVLMYFPCLAYSQEYDEYLAGVTYRMEFGENITKPTGEHFNFYMLSRSNDYSNVGNYPMVTKFLFTMDVSGNSSMHLFGVPVYNNDSSADQPVYPGQQLDPEVNNIFNVVVSTAIIAAMLHNDMIKFFCTPEEKESTSTVCIF